MKEFTIVADNGTIHLRTSGRKRGLFTATPKWSTEPEDYFMHRGQRHYLTEFEVCTAHNPLKQYVDAAHCDTFFSGVGIRLVQACGEIVGVLVYDFWM